MPLPLPPALSGRVVVIGAGPAGLTAARELTQHRWPCLVLEKTDHVGGLARTARYKGFAFDMGGHRFFTKAPEVQRLWREVLGDDLLRRPRLSRIYYRRTFFHYPLRALNALAGLGPVESMLIVASYVRWQVRPHPHEETFEQWVTNRFGQRLFRTFFRTYTEKVWGLSCTELRAEWAAQRIKDLSLRAALTGILRRPGRRIRSLIDEFHYPRLGPGMLWSAVADEVGRRGGEVRLGSDVVRIRRTGRRVEAVVVREGSGEAEIAATDVISSMPLRELIERLDPPAPGAVRRAAARLTYRDFITVCLIVDRPHLFPDNWIYVHDPEVRCGRIQNFKNWSAAMVPDPAKTSLGLE
jgi:protoporphyrinogen oxidase